MDVIIIIFSTISNDMKLNKNIMKKAYYTIFKYNGLVNTIFFKIEINFKCILFGILGLEI